MLVGKELSDLQVTLDDLKSSGKSLFVALKLITISRKNNIATLITCLHFIVQFIWIAKRVHQAVSFRLIKVSPSNSCWLLSYSGSKLVFWTRFALSFLAQPYCLSAALCRVSPIVSGYEPKYTPSPGPLKIYIYALKRCPAATRAEDRL